MVERIERKSKHDRAGAPTKYDPNIMPTVARLRTIHYWMNQHQEFHDAVQVGVDAFNARVERALAERAIGFFVTLREEVRDPETGRLITPAQRQYFPPLRLLTI